MRDGARHFVAIPAAGVIIPALISLFGGGCSGCTGYGPSHADMVAASKMDAVGVIGAKGGATVEKHYPQGEAYVVDLSAATVDDELIESLKSLDRISELNLSGSKITDEQFATLVKAHTLGMTYKLDMSDTGLSDASLRALTEAKQAMLGELNVKGSKVTPAGIAEFSKSRPRHPFGAKLQVTK